MPSTYGAAGPAYDLFGPGSRARDIPGNEQPSDGRIGANGMWPPPGMGQSQHFHYGSPESPLNPGSSSQWAAGAGTESKPFDPRDWSVDGKKPSKELKTFDGDMAHYDTWRRRVRDHFMGVNCNYFKVFDIVEK